VRGRTKSVVRVILSADLMHCMDIFSFMKLLRLSLFDLSGGRVVPR
jgi:hypothetical protein